ncbi:MAG: type transporter [Conexibacter sp.]|nr:type transporter [Conexibacter sp.]
MRWLLLKDLQILRRSPLLVVLLIVYPIVISLLIGFALSGGPSKPKIAVLNEIPTNQRTFDLGGRAVNADEYTARLFGSIDPTFVHTRADALKLVRDGRVLAAVILPADITEKLASGTQQATIEIAYNGEDAVKQRYVESVIRSRIADVNAALSKRFEQITVRYINLLLDGGSLNVFGRDLQVLGLTNAKKILDGAIASLPGGSPLRPALGQVDRFAAIAIQNLGASGAVLQSVSEPVRAQATNVAGSRRTPLDSYAVAVAVTVSLMFLTVLLASGLLALEREEHAFTRLVRGLVSRLGLLLEKIGLAALCSFTVTFGMVLALGAFFVELDWGRLPLWIVALAAGGIAFAAMGVAIGGVARELRAASLLAFLLALPVAFLALVPSGAVSSGLYDVVNGISAIFPFKPTLQALDAALNAGQRSIVGPLLHLLAVAVGYTVIARIALRRFG